MYGYYEYGKENKTKCYFKLYKKGSYNSKYIVIKKKGNFLERHLITLLTSIEQDDEKYENIFEKLNSKFSKIL